MYGGWQPSNRLLGVSIYLIGVRVHLQNVKGALISSIVFHPQHDHSTAGGQGVQCGGLRLTRVRVADDVFAEALTPQQIGTSLAQSDQARKRVRGESAQLLPVLQVKSGAEGGDRTRTGLRPQDFKSRVSGSPIDVFPCISCPPNR